MHPLIGLGLEGRLERANQGSRYLPTIQFNLKIGEVGAETQTDTQVSKAKTDGRMLNVYKCTMIIWRGDDIFVLVEVLATGNKL